MDEKSFWNTFFDDIWERRPAHLEKAIEPLLGSEELFALSVFVAESLAGGNDRLRVRWCDDGKRTRNLAPEPASGDLLPQRGDVDFEGYARRMSRHPTFFFQIPTLHLFHPVLWPRLVRLCGHIYPHTGVPGHMAWTDAYVGRYASTPFGVHWDGASNFTFGVHGSKTLYLWEPDYYEARMKKAGPHGYEPFVPDATKLTVGPGEAIYWPSRFYHVAVPDNRMSVTMNFAFYPDAGHGAWLDRAFRETIADTTSKQGPSHGLELPRDLAIACRSAVKKVASGALEHNLLKGFVAHTTRLGFLDPPPLRHVAPFEPGARAVGTGESELACVADGHGSLVLSANGYAIGVPESDTVRELVAALGTGRPIEVSADTRDIVDCLHKWGAVARYWEQGDNRGPQARHQEATSPIL